MKQAIVRGDYNGSPMQMMGYVTEYMWKSVAYFRAPDKSGRYLVIKKDGTIDEYMCTGLKCGDDKTLFTMAAEMSCNYDSDVFVDEHHASDTEILDTYRSPYSIWYKFIEWHEYEDGHTDLHIYTEESDQYPLYFLDLNLDEKMQIEENDEIHTDEDPVYFRLNGNLEYEQVNEEDKKSE